MTYTEFETPFFPAPVDAADASQRGQCEAFEVAETVLPAVKDQWVRDAVQGYRKLGYLGTVSESLGRTIGLMISGEGRKAAEALRAQIAAAQQPRTKIGF